MVASANIKTPSMTIPFLPTTSKREMEELRVRLNRVTLADVLERVEVREYLQLERGAHRERIMKLKFHFLPRKLYKDKYAVNKDDIALYFESKFVKNLLYEIVKASGRRIGEIIESAKDQDAERKKPAGRADDDDEGERDMQRLERGGGGEGHVSSDEEELADDADATEARKRRRQGDEDHDEGLSDEEQDMVNKLALELDGGAIYADTLEDEEAVDQPPPLSEEVEERQPLGAPLTKDSSVLMRRNSVKSLILSQGAPVTPRDYVFDEEKYLWCELTLACDAGRKTVDLVNLLRRLARAAVMHQIKDITRQGERKGRLLTG